MHLVAGFLCSLGASVSYVKFDRRQEHMDKDFEVFYGNNAMTLQMNGLTDNVYPVYIPVNPV